MGGEQVSGGGGKWKVREVKVREKGEEGYEGLKEGREGVRVEGREGKGRVVKEGKEESKYK